MSTPAVKVPPHATDLTYSDGPDVGRLTKIEPSDSFLRQGYVGGRAVSAQVDNWRQNAISEWVSYLSPIQLRNWSRLGQWDSDARLYCPDLGNENGIWWVGGSNNNANDSARIWGCPGAGFTGMNFGSADFLTWTGVKAATSLAVNQAGVMISATAGNASGAIKIRKVVLIDGSTSEVTVGGTTGAYPGQVVYVSGSDRFLLFQSQFGNWTTGTKYYYSDNAGDSWTELEAPAGGLKQIGGVVAHDNTVALYFTNSLQVWFSRDGGLTWEAFTFEPSEGGTGVLGLAYTSEGWLLLANDGTVHRSPTGQFYQIGRVDENVIPSFSVGDMKGNALASDGGRAAVMITEYPGYGWGVWWSLDAGENWASELLHKNHSTSHPDKVLGIRYAHNQFAVLTATANTSDSGVVYEVWASLRV